MDPNGTRYHLLLSQHDWLGEGVTTTPAGGLEFDDDCGLRLYAQPYRFPTPDQAGPPLESRRGAAADQFHNVYWIDDARNAIRVRSAGSGETSVFWEPSTGADEHPLVEGGFHPAAPVVAPSPGSLSGLAVTADHYLVVGTRAPDGLLVIDLYQPSSRTSLVWPQDVPFAPFDLAARTGGGIFVLDRDHRRLWELDATMAAVSTRPPESPEPSGFVAVGGTLADPGLPCPPRNRPADADAIPLPGDPWAVEGAPGGRALVLLRESTGQDTGRDTGRGSSGASEVMLLDPSDRTSATVALVDSAGAGQQLSVVAHDLARIDGPDRDGAAVGRVLVADALGNQAYAFDLREEDGALRATLAPDAWPMRLFGGKGLVADGDRVWYDLADTWVPLVGQRRHRHVERAVVRTRPLDGGLPGTVWHRLLLDAQIPPGCRVLVESQAVDDREQVTDDGWAREPEFVYRRTQGSELAFEADEVTAAGWATWEVLCQHAVGRWLHLRVTLVGDVRSTPSLRALRIYFPRPSYVERYLPAVYQEDAESASFLTRYLANTEGMLTDLEARIVAAQALVDPRTAPEDTLDWLFRWFDLAADPLWEPARKRLFLRQAVTFLGLRGTRLGLVSALRLALDECLDPDDGLLSRRSGPGGYRIVEQFSLRRPPVTTRPLLERTVGARLSRWDPSQGRDNLLERWEEERGPGAPEFPLADGDATWLDFVARVLGIDPPARPGVDEWDAFLRERYARIEDLNAAYGLVAPAAYASFEDVAVPKTLPADGAALTDWYHFVAVVAPSRRAAHRFTVLLPVRRASQSEADAARRRAIATRVVELQKPAHTTYGIRFFWAAFQVGSAVLGEDTQVELGGRDPQFHQQLVLGRDHAGEASLGGPPAPTGDHVGRDRLSS